MPTPLSASPMFSAKGHYKPFIYPWAFGAYREQSNAHWPATEIPLQEDVRDWNTKLSAAEKNLLTQIFRFFTQGDVDIGNAYVDRYIPVFKNEELRGMMTTFASVEVIHCFIEGTEVLTPTGWVDFRDLTDASLVAQYGPDKTLSWAQPSARINR